MGHPRLSHLVGVAVNHVAGQLAVNFSQGAGWELVSVTRPGNEQSASLTFAVGYRDPCGPDDRPRVTVGIVAHTWNHEPEEGQ